MASFAAGACSLALAVPAQAITFTVDDLSDAHDSEFPGPFTDGVCDATGTDMCTLRAALEEANNTVVGSDTINVSLPGTVNLTLGELVVSEVTIVNGNAAATTIDGGDASRVLRVLGASLVTLNDLRLQNGATVDDGGAGIRSFATLLTLNRVTVAGNTVNSAGGGYAGGGIATQAETDSLVLNDSAVPGNTIIGSSGLGGGIRAAGPLTLNRSTVSGNSTTLDAGGRGGGIDANAALAVALNISNSTISDNDSGALGGGGLFASSEAPATIVGSTIAGNTTLGVGGGVRVSGTTFTSENTIYAANTATLGGANCTSFAGAMVAENNIDTGTSCSFGTANGNQENVGTGPLGLGALASNGGPTQTRAIASGSVAQNAASGDCGGLSVDQRGTARPQGASCDIGAFELVPPPPVVTPPPVVVTPAPKKCKKGQKLKKGKCVKKKAKKK
jgi:hypothetical protein